MAQPVVIAGPVATRLYGGQAAPDTAGPTTTGNITLAYSSTVAGQYTITVPLHTDTSGIYGYEVRIGAGGAVQAIPSGAQILTLTGSTGDVAYGRAIDNSPVRNPGAWLSAIVVLPVAPSLNIALSASSGPVSSPVTVTISGANLAGAVTVTPSSTVPGSFVPASLSLAAPNDSKTTVFTPTGAAVGSIAITNSAGIANPAAQPFSAVAVAVVAARNVTALRNNRPLLFSDLRSSEPVSVTTELGLTAPRTLARASVADPKTGFSWVTYGPNWDNVEVRSGWKWPNPGGSWINTAGVPQATTSPHFSFAANAATNGSSTYTVNMVQAVNAAYNGKRWAAFIVRCVGGTRAFSALHGASPPQPIAVVYTDGTTGTLECRACARLAPGSLYSRIGYPEAEITPVALEFERPAKLVASANLQITVTQHTATPATIEGYLANPNTSAGPVTLGIAQAYVLDAGAIASPAVLMSQRYQDGSVLDDFVVPPVAASVYDRTKWSPATRGGTNDPALLPTAFGGYPVANKWVRKSPIPAGNLMLVDSTFTGDNFAPLVPGHGALRINIPAMTAADGAVTVSPIACDLISYFPIGVGGTEAVRQTNIRYYVRLASLPKKVADMRMTRSAGGIAQYAVSRGKALIGQQHLTNEGGNNTVGGGAIGHTARINFEQVPAELSNAGTVLATHSLDNGPAHADLPWGGMNGMAPSIYPDSWVCIEEETINNTFNPAGGSPADGIQRIYIDGQLAVENTGFQWRDGPIVDAGGYYQPSTGTLAPLGAWMNFYPGGTEESDHPMTVFVAMVQVAKSYIGPLKLPAAQVLNSVWTPTRGADGNVVQSDWATLPGPQSYSLGGPFNKLSDRKPSPVLTASSGGDAFHQNFTAWGSAAWDGSRKLLYHWGGGHGDSQAAEQTVYAFSADKAQLLPNVHSSPAASTALKLSNYADINSALVPGDMFPPGFNLPLSNGTPGAQHPWNLPQFIPPATMAAIGYTTNTKGGLFMGGSAKAVLNLDTDTFTKLHWKRSTPDNSNWTSALVGTILYRMYGGYILRFDLAQSELTDWQTSGYDPQPSVPSVGKEIAAITGTGTYSLPTSSKIFGRMDARNELVGFYGTSTKRVKIGLIHQAGAVAANHYENITLTSANGTDHLPFLDAANFVENDVGIQTLLCNAGCSYEPETQLLYVAGNFANTPIWEISGIAGTTWTVRDTGARTITAALNGQYGRFQAFRQAGRTFAVRMAEVFTPFEISSLTI